ncbi:MAG TPA: ComF family protein [Blastocatellia bacterium]|nr:ComF family protein [Blastocatellia bacterium]
MISLSSPAVKAAARLRDASLALLCPQECLVCGAAVESWRDGIACETCWREFDVAQTPVSICLKCGLEMPSLPAYPGLSERSCGQCDELAFACARSCGAYRGALRESVLRLKRYPQLAPRVSELLRSALIRLSEIQTVESIIPVPLHPQRQLARGFNQAEIIARALSEATGLYVDTVSLIREKETEMHRAGMSQAARARSLRKAFRVRAPRLIADRAVLVVDDVMTTGSTAHEIADTLLEAGARSVSVLTLARAVTLFH